MVIFINQIRMKIGVMFGSPETTTGGNALKFYASVRLDIRRIGSIKERDEVVGNQTRVKVVKNKLAPPFKQVEFDIMYGEGVSKTGELVDLGVKAGIVEKSGSWFSYNSQRLGQGRENAKLFLQRQSGRSPTRSRLALRQNAGLIAEQFLENGGRATISRTTRPTTVASAQPIASVDDDRRADHGPAVLLLADAGSPHSACATHGQRPMSHCWTAHRHGRLQGRDVQVLRSALLRHGANPFCEEGRGNMSGVNEIRSAFLDYFKKNGHEVVASSPLVPRNDPTLMFTNAGMVQFKNVFTGLEQRPYSRAATSQKCVRAGGKHNDLDNVGYTARHHTFFEMLGNFSFGDYFKERAIELAWNLITKEFGLAKDQLTGHRLSHRRRGVRPLEEDRRPARGAHHPHRDQRQFLGDGRYRPVRPVLGDLLRPRRQHSRAARPAAPDEDGDRFIEIWNLVFMQFEQVTKEERIDLPRPSIDTGMGLERIAAVLQGKHDNYDIDLFRALIRASEEATGVKAEGKNRASHRVIADHLRSSSFLIADGVLPSNEGRGYVLRRIMRRAMRHAQLLGAEDPLMWRLVPALVREMGQAYPELIRGEAADHRDAEARGDAFPQDAGARPWPARRRDRHAVGAATASTARPPSSSTTPTASRST